MNDLRELIGQEVKALIDKGKYGTIIKCKVIDLNIDDFHFEQKDERIYITVNVEPLEKLPKGIDYDDLNNIPLDDIRR